MKFVHISDTHGFEVPVPDGDVLIHTGDFSRGRGRREDCIALEQWLSRLPHKHKLLIPGNHDGICEWSVTEARMLMPSVRLLIDEVMEIDGIRIMGSPWSVRFMDWAFMMEDDRLERLYSTWSNVDIIASHGPAYQRLDHLGQEWACEEMHVGSKALLRAIDRVGAQTVLCGHIHAGYGTISYARPDYVLRFFNSAICDDSYRPVNTPQVFSQEPR